MIKAIILDFDGVIAESNNVKTEAFVALFNNYPQTLRETIRKFHLQNGGMSRFDKFKYIYANILKEPLPEEKFNSLCSDFNKLVFDKIVNAPLVEGIEGFLKRNRNRYDMCIVSGTPQDEIRDIIKERKLNGYFSGIYGSPKAKKELIEGILKENGYSPSEIVFLGDSSNDYEGAVAAGVEFVARVSENPELDMFPGVTLKTQVRTISDFEEYLNKK